jgi:UbiD family decarboxylase
MNFPESVDIALPAEGVFHNLVFVSIRKTYPMQAYKTMHGLWGMGQMMFTKYIIVVVDDVDVHNTSEVLFRLCANTDPQRDSLVVVRKDSPKARPTCSTTPPAKSPAAANSALMRRRNSRAKASNALGHRTSR